MDKKIEVLIKNWQKRNIQGLYFSNRGEAINKILELVSPTASVGISGSVTLDQLGIVKGIEARGNKVFNQYQLGLSREDLLRLRRQGSQADYYLTGVNAISQNGALVFFSAYGNRTSGISYAKNVMVVAGVNKITPDLESAIRRARQQATPANCKRLNYQSPCLADGICREDICLFPEYQRMCCQILIIEAEVAADRLKVILIDEELGF